MKKLYSTIMMLAMMVAALSITACGGDDDDETGGGGSGYSGEKQLSVYLQQAGTLSSIISKTQASNLLRLKISGHMDARDFDFIKWDCMKVEEVDLSEVIIDSYSGVEGTEEGNNKTYAANEIPSGAFFYWSNVHKYIYDGMPVDEGMASLKKIVLPNGIKAIRRNAFARAYNLTEINIPNGVESIDYVAFAICTSLEEIKLPASLKSVGKQAFASMKNIKRFYIDAQTPPSALNNSFDGIPSDAVLYVPSGTENQYKNAVGWNRFTKINGNTSTSYEDNDNNDNASSFTITYDGDTKEYEAGYQETYSEGIVWDNNMHYFFLGLLKPYGNVIIQFPSSVNASDFKAGTQFVDYSFQWISYAGGIWNFKGDYIAGSATVKSNDGKHIVVSFSNFSFNLSSKEVSKTHTMTIDGTIRFKI